MQTAIIVYQTTSMTISTHESDLLLCSMDNETVSLSAGQNARTVAPGIYKIVSGQDVQVSADASAFETVTTDSKTSIPPVPIKVTQSFASVSTSTWNAFFAVPDAKVFANP